MCTQPATPSVEYFASNPCPFVEVAPHEPCKGTPHFERRFQDILDMGGEGIILRDPEGSYAPGRSKGFLNGRREFAREAWTQNIEQQLGRSEGRGAGPVM